MWHMATSTSLLQSAGGAGKVTVPKANAAQPAYRVTTPQLTSGTIAVNRATNNVSSNQAFLDAARASQDATSRQIAALNSQLAAIRNAQAPAIDLASISARAKQQATDSVSPYYVDQLQKLIKQQAQKAQQAQAENKLTAESIAATLAQTLGVNATARTRSGQDEATMQGRINTQQADQQADAGTNFTQDYMAAVEQASANGGLAGLGGQQVYNAETAYNTGQERASRDFGEGRAAASLSKARTWEDLLSADTAATTEGELKGKAAKLDLDRIISETGALDENGNLTSYGTETQSGVDTLNRQQQQDILQNTQDYSRTLVNQFIAAITNPYQRTAAAQAYGNLF
jgi:hypothetical protein